MTNSEPSGQSGPEIDQARLKSLTDQVGSEIANELITMYLDDAPGRMEEIAQAIEKNDMETLRRQAHQLKSMSATLGGEQVSGLCAELEAIARNKSPGDVTELLATLRPHHDRLLEELKDCL